MINETTMENLIEVEQNQIPLKCEICDKEFKNNKSLKNHFNIIHNYLEKKHQCNICQKYFNIQSQLSGHLKSVHEKKKDHKCDFCRNFFF